MPPPAMDIRMIKDVLRLKLHGGLSHEAIARSLSISKGVVAKYVSLAAADGLAWDTIAGLSEAELERRLLGRNPDEVRIVEPDFGRVHLELRRKGVTLTPLGQEYRAEYEGQRTWGLTQLLRRRLSKRWADAGECQSPSSRANGSQGRPDRRSV